MAWELPTHTIEAELNGHSYPEVILAADPEGYWQLNEASGTVAADSSGNGHTGTIVGGVTLGQAGARADGDKAMLFDGTTESVDVTPIAINFATGGFTFECWYMSPVAGQVMPFPALCGLLSTTHMQVRLNLSTGQVGAYLNGNAAWLGASGSIGTLGVWHHIVVVYDGFGSSSRTIYIDGVAIGTEASGTPSDATEEFLIGNNAGLDRWTGHLDEVALYNRALTTDEIAVHYAARFAGTWTDITPDTTNDPYRLSYGIKTHRPEIRVAESGTLSWSMRNDANNSGGQLGYYSPFHANKRLGWGYGIRVRLKQVYGADTRYWMGRLDSIVPEPGQFEGRTVACVAVDFMNEAARANAPTAIQVNKRSDQVFSAVLANMADQPVNTSIDVGRDTYVYALHNISPDTKVLAIWADLAKSELGIIACVRDATAGQTLKFESRSTRTLVTAIVATLDNTMHGLEFPGGRSDILNVFRVHAYPAFVSAAIVVASIDAPFTQSIYPGETRILFLDYTDPSQRDTKIGATNQIAPVATTDYTMNSQADGSGNNLTASFTVTATFFSSSVMLEITNNSAFHGYIRTLQVRGDGIFTLNPITAEASDDASIAQYGVNVAELDMPYQSNPFVASDATAYLKAIYKDPLANVRVVRFRANQSAALLTAAIKGEISNRVRLAETVSGLTAATDYVINGVEHEIGETEVMDVAWWLAPASTTAYWQLGTAGAGELGLTTRLAF